MVRHGHLPEREIMTGIGSVAVRQSARARREADRASAFAFQSGDSAALRPAHRRASKC